MPVCVHHLLQEIEDTPAPFGCSNCDKIEVIETDFHKLFEIRNGRPWDHQETYSTNGDCIAA